LQYFASRWAISEFANVKETRENLAARERTNLGQIHSVVKGDAEPQTDSASGVNAAILSWLESQQNLEAAVWTALTSNWKDRRGKTFSPEDAVAYLSDLKGERDEAAARYDRASEYIRNTPAQIQTSVRAMLRDNNDFKDAALGSSLFQEKLDEAE
jgi:hypothetical protein